MSDEEEKGEGTTGSPPETTGDAGGVAPVAEPRAGGVEEDLPSPCEGTEMFRRFFPRLDSEQKIFFEGDGGQAYELVDLYCPVPECDCENVLLAVMKKGETSILAILNSIVPEWSGEARV